MYEMIRWLFNIWGQGALDLKADDLRGALYIYRIYLVGLVLAILNLLLGHLTIDRSFLIPFYLVGSLLLLVILSGLVLLYKRFWLSAATLLFSFVWLLVNGIALMFRGAQDPVSALHIPLLIAVGYYFNFRWSLRLLAVDICVLGIIAYLHQSGIVQTVSSEMFSHGGDFVFWTISFTSAGALIYLSTQRARDSQADIEAKNEMLAKQQTLLERNKANLELEVSKRTKQLEWAKNRAEEASNAKSIFLAKMSHELRTPLNIIIGYSEMIQEVLEESPQEDELFEDAGRIRSAGQHLLHIIDNILALTRIEEGHWHIEIAPIQINELLTDLSHLAEPLFAKGDNCFEIIWEFDDDPTAASHLRVLGDKQMVMQIFLNLLSNAAKFTQQGEIKLYFGFAEHMQGGQMARFAVADTGKGINEDFLPHIFHPFQQEEESYAREHEGTGLGLAISKEMVDRMGGEIYAENNENGGATFTVLLPFADPI